MQDTNRGVQRQQGRVLTSDNDHHYPDTDTCCSAAVSGGRICSDAERAANHYSDSNTGGANITTLSNIKHPLLTQLTHDSLILHVIIIILLEPGNPDPVPRLPLTVTVLCVTCKLSLPVMHRAPAPRSSSWPPPPSSPAHRRHPGHVLCVLLQQNVTGILIFNRQTGNQSHLHNLSVVPVSHSALAPTSVELGSSLSPGRSEKHKIWIKFHFLTFHIHPFTSPLVSASGLD